MPDLCLICPRCGASLVQWAAARAAKYACPGCQAENSFADAVFRFVDSDDYLESFSFQWTTHAWAYES